MHNLYWKLRSFTEDIEAAIDESGLIVGSVISGNRNFEGRVPQGQGIISCQPTSGGCICNSRQFEC